MYAYFRTIPPVRQANREHQLAFPYNQRHLLAFWRALYFTPGVFEPDAGQTAEWNRGAYLVQGLGHCAACHTPRNALGGSLTTGDLAGGMISMLDWHAPSLTSGSETGIGSWSEKEIARMLRTGVSDNGAVYGPMAEVVSRSLQHLSQHDVDAMAGYLKSVPKKDIAAGPGPSPLTGDARAVLQRGAKLYEANCAACHMADGTGAAPAYGPLAGNKSLSLNSAVNPIRMVLAGGYPPSTGGNPRPYGMPPFGPSMTDSEVAAVVSYIRSSWGNKGGQVSPVEVNRLRSGSSG